MALDLPALRTAAHLGFGYRAPHSDAAAVELLRNAWDENETRTLAEVELIDVRDRNEVVRDLVALHHSPTLELP